MGQQVVWSAAGTGLTFLMTHLGAALVFVFKKAIHANGQRAFLGFATGVVVAAAG